MIVTSESITHISKALLKFQGAVDGVGKTAENPGFKRDGKALKYANLESVIDTAKPELQAVGVLFLQSGGPIFDGIMSMTTRLIHAESGEWIEGTMAIALGKHDPQGVGSAQTYAQRYHLMAMLGLPPIDDDGEAAVDRGNTRPVSKPKGDEEEYNRADFALSTAPNKATLKVLWDATLWGSLNEEQTKKLTETKDHRLTELNAKIAQTP